MPKKAKKTGKSAKKAQKRGPKPEILKIEGDWVGAVKKAMAKGKPASSKE